jgi:hypothetical protein
VNRVSTQDYVEEECGTCGVLFTVPAFLHACRAGTGQPIFCSNGHALTIPQPDEMNKLQTELASVKSDRDEQVRLLSNLVEKSRAQTAEVAHLHRRIASLRGSNTMLQRKLRRSVAK